MPPSAKWRSFTRSLPPLKVINEGHFHLQGTQLLLLRTREKKGRENIGSVSRSRKKEEKLVKLGGRGFFATSYIAMQCICVFETFDAILQRKDYFDDFLDNMICPYVEQLAVTKGKGNTVHRSRPKMACQPFAPQQKYFDSRRIRGPMRKCAGTFSRYPPPLCQPLSLKQTKVEESANC